MRAQVVLLQGDHILLAQHRRPGHDYWVLPGGAVEAGETPENAAVREVREETGLDVRIDRLLFVDQPQQRGEITIRSPRYTYLARTSGGELMSRADREGGNEANGYLAGASWMPFESSEYDDATRATLQRVCEALGR